MPPFAKDIDDLLVYQNAFAAAMEIFRLTQRFPPEERYSMTDQIRRSSRSVCSNLAEAWRKRRYKAAFIAKLSDAESEAGETLTWINMATSCHYLDSHHRDQLKASYQLIISQIVRIIESPDSWLIR